MHRNLLLAVPLCGVLFAVGYLSGAADKILGRTAGASPARATANGSEAAAVDHTAWRRVAGGANVTAYADIDSLRRNGPLVSLRALLDFAKPPFDGNNLPYLSLTMRNEYDCGEKRFRTLSITSHAGHMGSGERPYTTSEPSEWETVRATAIQNDLWKLACAASAPETAQPESEQARPAKNPAR